MVKFLKTVFFNTSFLKPFALGVFCFAIAQTISAQPSVLHTGKWYKLAVEKNGVYRITFEQFKKMGFDPSKTDPRKIRIYGNTGGMLPQENAASRPFDLTERAIFVQGESDGKFNSNDYILFYGEGADRSYFDLSRDIFFHEKNLYADKNYYFITVAEDNGKRLTTRANLPGIFPVITEGENFVYYELDQHNELKSGREWYGEKFDLTTEFTKTFSIPDIAEGSTMKLVSDVMAQSFTGSSFKVLINGVEVMQQAIAPISNTQYGVKGRDRSDTLSFAANAVLAPTRTTQEIKYQYVKGSGFSIGYLDNFLLQVTQQLKLRSGQSSFRSSASLLNAVSTFEIAGTTSATTVWDVTNPSEPMLQTLSFESGTSRFSTETTTLKEFVIFSSPLTPELEGSVANQNIKGNETPAFIIVTHPSLKSEALRLASHRTTKSNLSTLVVTTTEVFNEFSSGRQDVSAIRDMARFFYLKNSGTLKALLLFGKGSYDYKNRVVDNINLVPLYESRNSLHPLLTYSSDDYFGFLEVNEGNWREDPVVNHSMDIATGRIPAKNVEEAKNVVDKIIAYDEDKKLLGRWRKDLVFIADDGDFNLHNSDADELAESIELNHAEFNVKKLFLDNYPQLSRPGGEVSPETYAAIEKAFYDGALVINYTGHGGERLWAQERIFDDLLIETLENKRLPLLVTATCEFGRQDDPVFISGAELAMLKKNGGAIGLVTTARPVNAATNFLLNQAFYNALFQQENNQYLLLGEIFRRTKNTSLSGVSNRNFSLIGDPSLRLAMPAFSLEVTQIQTAQGSSDLKALSTVAVAGRVLNNDDETVTDFNGVVDVVLFDKENDFLTLGDENQPFPFKLWYNALFRGKASVVNGEFEFQFIVPKNIAYTLGEGKLSLYAYNESNHTEAAGFSKDFIVGASEENVVADTQAPIMQLYIGDTSFESGGIASPTTTLIAKLQDESGINISGYGIGNSIIGTLDDTQSFILNDYYECDLDDFKAGSIHFPLQNLTPGKHTLTVKAWDTHNNPVVASIEFVVTEDEQLKIEEFGNYPNPFNVQTTLFFTHNRSGDDLLVSLQVLDHTGQLVRTFETHIPFSSYKVDLLELSRDNDFLANRSGNVYFARLFVRSLTNGSKNEQVTKLILSN